MATRQQRPPRTRSYSTTRSQTNNGPTLFWLIVVLGLIGLVFYFGFVKVS